MNEFDELVEEMDKDSGRDLTASSSEAAATIRSNTRPEVTPAAGFPSSPAAGISIDTMEDVVRVLAERGAPTIGRVSTPSPPGLSPPRSAKARRRKQVERGDGKCRAYAPKGTKCKMCGKVHP